MSLSPAAFRRLALALPGATESSHGGHPDFRAPNGKIFATLGYPNAEWGVLVLCPDQQDFLIDAEPEIFSPVKGAWGLRGSTLVNLRAAKTPAVRKAIEFAWKNRTEKRKGK